MVAYRPPDGIVLNLGATFRALPLRTVALRLVANVVEDEAAIAKHLPVQPLLKELNTGADEMRQFLQDPVLKKHDTPLQMAELQELLARIRGWLIDLREMAIINLSHDQPAVERIVSWYPEVADGYARDVLRELEARLAALRDLRPRLEGTGVDDRFLTRGNRLAQQLRTAIGKEDLQSKSLQFKLRHFYMRKGFLYLAVKRASNAGRVALRSDPGRRHTYLIPELEPDPRSLS